MASLEDIAKIAAQLGLTDDQAKKLATELDNIDKKLRASVEHLKEQQKNLELQKEIVGKIADEHGRVIEKEQISIELAINAAKQAEAKAKAEYQAAQSEKEKKDAVEAILKAQKEITGELEKQKDLSRAKEVGEDLAKLLGIDESNKKGLIYQMFTNPDKVLDGLTSKVQDAGGFMRGIGISFLAKVEEISVIAMKQYDSVSASLNKATGAAGSLNRVLESSAKNSTSFGISYEEAGKAVEGLYNNLNTFNKLNSLSQVQLTTTVAKLEQLGISSAESAKSIATLSQMMDQSDIQSAKTINQMAALGVAIGKSPQQISQDFAQASNSLAGYGDRMVDVFKDLEIQSKATGVAISDLLSIAEKFQTFEGAATAAGKLNAALGGNFVNTMQLLEASSENPAKAIDLLRTSLDQAGMSFNEMNFFEKKMIADAAGFKSVEEASRLLSMTNAEREKEIKSIDAQRASQEKLDEAIQKSIPITQKLQMMAANLAIVFGPLIDVFSTVLSVLGALLESPIVKFITHLAIIASVAAAVTTPLGWIGVAVYALAAAFSSFHDVLFLPHSPILFDSLKEMPDMFKQISSSSLTTALDIGKTTNSLAALSKSVVAVQDNKMLRNASEAVTDLNVEKTINTMKVVSNNINQQTNNSSSPVAAGNTTVEVHIGSEKIKDMITKTVTKSTTGSITTPATITPASRL